MNILYITLLKHVIRRFRICNYFCELFKFHNFMKVLMIFAKYIIDHKIAKFKYFAKVLTYSKSLDHVPQSDIEYVRILSV